MIPDNTKGYVWQIGKPFSTKKVQTFGQYRKTGGNIVHDGQDGPEIKIKGKYHGYTDEFLIKSVNGRKYVFYTVHHYTGRPERKSEYLLPGPRIGRAYKDWQKDGVVRFY